PIAATIALEVSGPIPGTLISRSQPASWRARASISPDRPSRERHMGCGQPGFGNFLYCWQTLISGGLALLAAVLAVAATAYIGRQQVAEARAQLDEVKRQNLELKIENQRSLARQGLVAARLIRGALDGTEASIGEINSELDKDLTGRGVSVGTVIKE